MKVLLGLDDEAQLIDSPHWKINHSECGKIDAISGYLFLVMAFEWSATFSAMDEKRVIRICDGVIFVPIIDNSCSSLLKTFLGEHVEK
jgi:hypothetical protein